MYLLTICKKYYKIINNNFITNKGCFELSNIILSLCNIALENSRKKVSIGKLNELILDCVRANEPPSVNGKRLKIGYVTQADTVPPTFILFVNDQTLMHFSYKRYLENSIRNAFGFEGTPINIVIREKDDAE